MAATTGYQTKAFAEAGRRMGMEMILATDRCHILDDPWGDRAVPVRFERPEEAAESLARLEVDGVVAVGDRPAWVAAMAAERLGLKFHAAEAVRAAGDKHLARERFTAAGLVSPEYYRMAKDSPVPRPGFYPCVLKPLGLSASRGVIRANDEAEFLEAAARIRKILERPEVAAGGAEAEWIQVERYLEGKEFALEGLASGGILKTLAIFDKPDPLNGPYFEETIYVTPSRETAAVQTELREAAQRGVTALGLKDGPVHAEMRLTGGGVFVLEIAARPIGGLCSRALVFTDGVSLEERILRHAVGEAPDSDGEALPGGAMMIPIPKSGVYESAAGVEKAREVPGITEVAITAKPGQRLERLPEGGSYLGFLFARGTGAEASLRLAHQELSFSIQSSLSITKNSG